MSYDIDRRKEITTKTIRLKDEDLQKILKEMDRGSTIIFGDIEISIKDPVEYAWYKWVLKMELKYRSIKDIQTLDVLHKMNGGVDIG